ncbi:MAG: hypothetical protein OEY14_09310, partial [Myxococcales bacterium]|nr:hypothetical protein [Myxococcales bacterium]
MVLQSRIVLLFACGLWGAGCWSLDLEPSEPPVVAIYDSISGDLPMPNDVLRDALARRLELPTDDPELSEAERDLRRSLNGLDGWSSAMDASVHFSGAIEPSSINASSVQIWRWGAAPSRERDATIELVEEDRRLRVRPPRTGWEHGETYVVLVRSGEAGLRDLGGR